MRSESRLLQVFLSKAQVSGPGIYEVSIDDDGNLFCTCPKFEDKFACKHTKFVLTRIEINNGHYPLEILNKATEDEAAVARVSNDAYRSFIIKYGKIEVY
jgi:SWIM zinc finger